MQARSVVVAIVLVLGLAVSAVAQAPVCPPRMAQVPCYKLGLDIGLQLGGISPSYFEANVGLRDSDLCGLDLRVGLAFAEIENQKLWGSYLNLGIPRLDIQGKCLVNRSQDPPASYGELRIVVPLCRSNSFFPYGGFRFSWLDMDDRRNQPDREWYGLLLGLKARPCRLVEFWVEGQWLLTYRPCLRWDREPHVEGGFRVALP